MNTINTRPELRENLSTLERYMDSADVDEKEFHRGLVEKGTCFVADQKGSRYLFAPSRFVGYKQNTMILHQQNASKHGSYTNRAIDKILGPCRADTTLNELYRKFCTELGFPARAKGTCGNERKFWRI